MKRIFRWEIGGIVVAAIAAGVSLYAEINFLPSIFLMVVGFLMMGVFAELEDEVLKKIADHSIRSHDWHLTLLRVVRTSVLIFIGVLVFAVLGRQF